MTMDSADITQLLSAIEQGNPDAAEALYHNVYNELRVIAHSHRRRWVGNETINTTVLIHEAYLKLAGTKNNFENRVHFYATASRAMRQVLVNYGERENAAKRQSQYTSIDISSLADSRDSPVDELLNLDQVLKRLERQSERRSRIVEYRVFGGLSIDETAVALNLSPATVKREWNLLSAWVYRELRGDQTRNVLAKKNTSSTLE